MSKNLRTVMLYLLLLAVVAWIIMTSFSNTTGKAPEKIPTSDFVEWTNAGKVSNVTYLARDGKVEGFFYDSPAAAGRTRLGRTTAPRARRLPASIPARTASIS